MKTSVTQMVILGTFVFFLVVAVFIFATYGTSSQNASPDQIEIWGTMSEGDVSKILSGLKDRYRTQAIPVISYRGIKRDEFDNILTESLADGVGPDVVLIPNDLIITNQKRLTTIGYDLLSERDYKDSFIEGSEILLTGEGPLAVPVVVDPLVMYWNRDYLTSKGVARAPATWEEMISIIDRLTEKEEDRKIVKSAIAFGDFGNVKYAKDILLMLIIQSGGRLIERDEKDQLVNMFLEVKIEDIYPLSSSISFFTQFSDPLKPIYSWNRSLSDSEQAFLNGDLAFYFAPASEAENIRTKSPSLNFDVAPVPQPKNGKFKKVSGHIFGFSILNSSQKKQAAFEAISLLTNYDSAKMFAELTNLPPARRDLLQSPAGTAFGDVFWRSAVWTFPWLDPNPRQTDQIFGEAIDSVVTGKLKLENISGFISSRIDELVR